MYTGGDIARLIRRDADLGALETLTSLRAKIFQEGRIREMFAEVAPSRRGSAASPVSAEENGPPAATEEELEQFMRLHEEILAGADTVSNLRRAGGELVEAFRNEPQRLISELLLFCRSFSRSSLS